MRVTLSPHPATPGPSIRIAVDVERRGPKLHLTYDVTGDVAALILPPAAVPARTDELWKHTCFEAFLRNGAGQGYAEFNFAPSTAWAAYRFDGYRDGMASPAMAAPELTAESTLDRFVLKAAVVIKPAFAAPDALWQIAITAVIEETDGRKSYWSLAHPPGKPDFHHSDGFAVEIAAPSAA